MFEPSSKKVMLAVLVTAFVVQTGLVYSDDVDIVLSEDAVQGRKLFHDGSCQVCHQLWGQGGFLGPDLTNAASRVDETRLASLLTVGSGQMPAFEYDEQDLFYMRAFLAEIDRTDVGRGQLRLGDPAAGTSPQAAFAAAVIDVTPPDQVLAGFRSFRSGICSACHFPFQTSVVGAPDLSTVVERVDDPGLRLVLSEGRPTLGMPAPAPTLSEEEAEEVISYLHWLNVNRSALLQETARRRERRSIDWSGLAWWEFR